MKRIFPNEYFYNNEIYPIKYSKFGNLLLPIPNNPIDYLNRTYPDWDKFNRYEQFSFIKFKITENKHVLPSDTSYLKLCY